jgi:hypothetical protein
VGDAVESFTVVDNIARIRVVGNLTGLSWKHRDFIGADCDRRLFVANILA